MKNRLEAHVAEGLDASRAPDGACRQAGPSEEECHREHRAALEATLFHDPASPDEVVLELDSGLLRLLQPDR